MIKKESIYVLKYYDLIIECFNTTYNAMERVVDIFELGKEVLKERDEAWKVKNNKNKEKLKEKNLNKNY